jgi:mRNA interferase RelE/StbE
MSYALTIKPTAQRQIRQLDLPMVRRIIRKLEQLQQNPRPPGVRKLQGAPGGYRVRFGKWRILYTVDDQAKEIHVYQIKPRSKAY